MSSIEEELDILVLAAHPDDAELCCGGTILKQIALGYKVGILDLTQGELGTRGSAETRLKESALASRWLGISMRANLNLKDGFFRNDPESQLKIIAYLRKYKPKIVLANAIEDRHPDHTRGSHIARESCFYSGLRKVETFWEGVSQEAWRPPAVYYYVQDRYLAPDFVVDISDFMEKKLEVLKAFSSQFYDPNSSEPSSYISSPDFMDSIIARARELGKPIGAKFAEAFNTDRFVGIDNLFNIK